ncbi:MAG: DHHA1 domain-containing protein, partial [Pseudomonadota bacterium]
NLKRQLATGKGTELQDQIREVCGVKVLTKKVQPAEPKVMREAGDSLRNHLGSGVVVLGGECQGKANLLVMVTKDLTNRFHAGKLVGELAKIIEGKGGGRPDLAQAGGRRVDLIDDAMEAVFRIVEKS